jgi:acetoin utilization protein AcuB
MGEVAELMKRSLVTIGHRTPLEEAWRLMRTRGIRHLPVLDDERRLVGIVSDHDLHQAILERCLDEEPEGARAALRRLMVNEIMTWGVVAVSPETDLREAGRIMRDRRVGALAVAGEGRVVGMLTATDVLDRLLGASGGGDARSA